MTWLLDTLVWTGALIGLVLAVRRPVARHFGARAAYALWVLPLMRLALPPIVLPASMAPKVEPVATAPNSAAFEGEPVLASVEPVSAGPDWWTILAALWFAGAVVYIGMRLHAYRQLRGELLADARAVGSAGRVRLVETRATRSPLAFGLIDKVIALPPGFMAQSDRAARDLALAHELAHHRAHDLAANFAALPLFALHWFNPLSWLGWNAMRRDQEAACDARVVEGRARTERACYAALIAEAVAAPKFALAAPMACPVLGDKSIIHRLKNLTMADHSLRRRRAGTLLVGAAALALPLTASFSYAQPEAAGVPEAPLAPMPPEAPIPPEARVAPVPPEAPIPPETPGAVRHVVDVDADGHRHVYVVRSLNKEHVDKARHPADRIKVHKIRKVRIVDDNGRLIEPDSPEFHGRMKGLEKDLENLDKEIERSLTIDERAIERAAEKAEAAAERAAERAEALAEAAAARAEARAEAGAARAEARAAHNAAGHARASLAGMRAARAAIANNATLDEETRRQVVKSMDREIARIEGRH